MSNEYSNENIVALLHEMISANEVERMKLIPGMLQT